MVLGGALLSAVVGWTLAALAQTSVRFGLAADVEVSVGSNAGPQSLVVTDMNGDDEPDIVVIEHDADSVSVFVNSGEGDGSFEDEGDSFLLDGSPVAIATGNFNLDSVVDIAVAYEEPNQATLLLSDVASPEHLVLDEIEPVALNGSPVGIAGLKIDSGNTIPDLAVLTVNGICTFRNASRDNQRVLEPFGSCFSAGGNDPLAIAAADFDGDGDEDLAVLDNNNKVYLHRNNNRTDGTFASPIAYPAGTRKILDDANAIAAGDVTGDGIADLVVAGRELLGGDSVTVLIGGNGGFVSQVDTQGVFASANALALADFDGDSNVDVVAAQDDDDPLGGPLLLGDGTGGFVLADSVSVAGGRAIAAADVNGDDDPDFLYVNTSGNAVRVAIQGGVTGPTPTGTRQATSTITVTFTPTPEPTETPIRNLPLGRCDLTIAGGPGGGEPIAVASGDMDRDGDPDMVVLDRGRRQVRIVQNPAVYPTPGLDSSCSAQLFARDIDLGSDPAALSVADLNRDARPDIVVTGEAGVTVLLAPDYPLRRFSAGTDTRGVTVVDVNRDGNPDVVTADTGSQTIVILTGDGTGNFTAQAPLALNKPVTLVVAEDLNRDTRPDLVAASESTRELVVLSQDGEGTFRLPGLVVPLAANPTGLALGNFNGDGTADVVVSEQASNGAGTAQIFTTSSSAIGGAVSLQAAGDALGVGNRPSAVGASDFSFDGMAPDGVLDVVTSNFSDDTVSLYQGVGAVRFVPVATSRFPLRVGQGPRSLAIADFDRDGRPDVVTANSIAGTLTLLRSSQPPPTVTPTRTRTATETFSPSPTGTITPTFTPSPTTSGTRTHTKTPTPPRPFSLEGEGCAVGSGAPASGGSLVLGAALALWGLARRRAPVEPNRATILTSKRGSKGRRTRNATNITGVLLVMTLLAGDASAQTYLTCPLLVAANAPVMAIADLDRNGSSDVALLDLGNTAVDAKPLSVLTTDLTRFAIGACAAGTALVGVDTAIARPAGIDVADVDGNGSQEILVSEQRGVRIFTRSGSGDYSGQSPIPAGSDHGPIVARDFDRDGIVDLAVGSRTGESVSVLYGIASGGFETRAQVISLGQTIDRLVTGDFNLDGRPDLAALSTLSERVRVMLPQASPARSFTLTDPIVSGSGPRDLTAADMNRDGVLDLIVSREVSLTAGGVRILYGAIDGTGVTFARTTEFATGRGAVSVIAADFNGDGPPDIAVASQNEDAVLVHRQVGEGVWGECPSDACTRVMIENPAELGTAFLDADALPDIIVASTVPGGNGQGVFFLLSSNPAPTPTPTDTVPPIDTETPTATPTRTPTHSGTPTPSLSPTRTARPTVTFTPGFFQLSGEGCAIAPKRRLDSLPLAGLIVILLGRRRMAERRGRPVSSSRHIHNRMTS